MEGDFLGGRFQNNQFFQVPMKSSLLTPLIILWHGFLAVKKKKPFNYFNLKSHPPFPFRVAWFFSSSNQEFENWVQSVQNNNKTHKVIFKKKITLVPAFHCTFTKYDWEFFCCFSAVILPVCTVQDTRWGPFWITKKNCRSEYSQDIRDSRWRVS